MQTTQSSVPQTTDAAAASSGYQASIRPNAVRLAAVFYPSPGISHEAFSDYWLKEHGRLFMSLDIVKKNLTKYEQFHHNGELTRNLAAALSSSPDAGSFYGTAIFEAESFEKIIEVFSDPEYQRVVLPDEQNFIDRSRTQLFGGGIATIWEGPIKTENQ